MHIYDKNTPKAKQFRKRTRLIITILVGLVFLTNWLPSGSSEAEDEKDSAVTIPIAL